MSDTNPMSDFRVEEIGYEVTWPDGEFAQRFTLVNWFGRYWRVEIPGTRNDQLRATHFPTPELALIAVKEANAFGPDGEALNFQYARQ